MVRSIYVEFSINCYSDLVKFVEIVCGRNSGQLILHIYFI